MRAERLRERKTRPVQVQTSRLVYMRSHPEPPPMIDVSEPHAWCPWCDHGPPPEVLREHAERTAQYVYGFLGMRVGP